MTKTKWFKITSIILIIITVFLIVYDIFVAIKVPGATISRVIMNTSYQFPLIIYSWFLIGGHFLSPIRTAKTYLAPLLIVSIVVLIISFLTVFSVIETGIIVLSIVSLIGFITGSICWSQRRK